jgi:hypothetical protein
VERLTYVTAEKSQIGLISDICGSLARSIRLRQSTQLIQSALAVDIEKVSKPLIPGRLSFQASLQLAMT